jgi:hypothetical protein
MGGNINREGACKIIELKSSIIFLLPFLSKLPSNIKKYKGEDIFA